MECSGVVSGQEAFTGTDYGWQDSSGVGFESVGLSNCRQADSIRWGPNASAMGSTGIWVCGNESAFLSLDLVFGQEGNSTLSNGA